MKFAIIAGVTLIAAITASSFARADTEFSYRGELLENGNLANGVYSMDYSLWDAVAGGNQIGATITINAVQVTDGRFTVALDFGAAALDNTDRWLEVAVNATSLVPRQPITRVPYAIQTRGINVSEERNVGIGVADPIYPLHLESQNDITAAISNTLSGDFTTYGVVSEVLADQGTGVWARHSSTDGVAPAILGETLSFTAGAVAVRGLASADSGESYGVVGESAGLFGRGVFGWAKATVNTTNYGVFGQADSPFGIGVLGYHPATTGTGAAVYGNTGSRSDYAVAVYGIVTSIEPGVSSAAVRGENQSQTDSGIGVWGSQNGDGYGVYGSVSNAFVAGGFGGAGVAGRHEAQTGLGIGVIGRGDSPGGWDFFANGIAADFGSPSSIRWKHNVANISNPLEKLSRLRGVYFDWDSEHGGRHDVGMIAEEVGVVLPEIVQYEPNGIDANGMDYSKMTPLLVEAVNALRTEKDLQIESQALVIVQLQEDNKKLNARLDAIEELFSQLSATTAQR
jgi:hypothetical protein